MGVLHILSAAPVYYRIGTVSVTYQRKSVYILYKLRYNRQKEQQGALL
jgi:hypothetical protein